MELYIERTVSPPSRADQVRDKSKAGESIYGKPFRVLDLADDGLMTTPAAEQAGRTWFSEHGTSQSADEAPLDELTVRFRDANEEVVDLVLREVSG